MAQVFECKICHEEYQQEQFEEHRKMCMTWLMFRCIICDGNYVSKEGLWNHLDLHEIANESKELHYQQITATYKLHQCALCNDQRGYQENLYWKHVHEVHNGFLQWCSDCGENFQSQTLKADHDFNHCKAKEQTATSALYSDRQFSNIIIPMQDENTASLVSSEERHEKAVEKLEPLEGELSCVPLEDNKSSGINTVDYKLYEDIDIDSRLIEFSPGYDTDNNMTEKKSEMISIPRPKSRSETDVDQITLKMEITVEETTLLHHHDHEISTPNQSTITDCPDVVQHSKDQNVKNSELSLVEFSRQEEKESDVIPIPSTKNMSETDTDQITLKMEIKVEETTLLQHDEFCSISTPNQSTIRDCPDVGQQSKDHKVKNSEFPAVEFNSQVEKESDVIHISSTKVMSETDTDQITLKMEITVEETKLLQQDEFFSISTPNQSTITGCPDVGQHSKDQKTFLRRNKKVLPPTTRRTRRMMDVDAHLELGLNSTDRLPCPSSDRYRATSDQNVEITSNQRPSTSREGTMRTRSLRQTRSNPPPVDHSTSSEASDFSIDESSWEANESSSEQNSRKASPSRKQVKEDLSKTFRTDSGFKCPDCGKLFKSQYHLRRHMAVHLKAKQKQISKSIEILKNPKECTICGIIITGNMDYHKYRAHTEPKYKCSQCPKMLYTNQNRRSHEATHCKTQEKNVVCSLCPKTFRDAYTLKLHVYNAHPSSESPCSMCDLKFSNRGKLMTHMKTFHTVSRFKCPDCGKLFISRFFLRRHMAVHLKKKQKLLGKTMKISEQQIGDDVELNQNSSLQKSKTCSICGLIISGNMEYHQRTTHTEPKHKCSHCAKMFYYNCELKLHETTHTLERNAVCKLCPKTFRNKHRLHQHVSYAHSSSELSCGMCNLKFSYRQKLTYHMLTAHTEPKYKCSHCPKMCYTTQNLKNHEATHNKNHTNSEPNCHETSTHSTLERNLVCELCPRTFKNEIKLKCHVYNAHPPSELPCGMCDLKFSTRPKLRSHMRYVHAERKHKCTLCPKMYFSKQDLNYHEKSTHSKTLEKYEVCSLCPKTFRDASNLKRHVYYTHPSTELPCDMCTLKFSTRYKLWSHKLKVHDEKNVACKLCPRTFGDKSKLKNHLYSAHTSVESPCSMCDLKFSNHHQLLYHMQKAHLPPELPCGVCDLKFSNRKKLSNHMQKAHAEPKYKCSHCSKKFYSSFELNHHEESKHSTLEKKFVCELCPRKFQTKLQLKRHVYYVHPPSELPCGMCDLKFSTRQKLSYHMNMIHTHRFKCPECLKPFHASSSLRMHMEIHSKATDKQHSSDGSKRRRLKTKGEKPPSDGLTRRRSKGKRKMPSSDDSYVVGQEKKIMMPSSELRRSNRMRTKQ